MEQVKEIIVFVAPLLAGFITTVLLPILIKNKSIKSVEERIEKVSPPKKLEDIEKKIDKLTNEVMEMRGKRK